MGGFLSDDGRRKSLKNRQERKRGTLPHPYLGEKPGWDMIPYVQALQSPPSRGRGLKLLRHPGQGV